MTAKHLTLWVTLALCITVSLPAASQSGNGPSTMLGAGYDLTWNTIDSGGTTFSTGDGYQLGGAIGQPDAGVLAGGGYSLGGGFWRGGAAISPPYRVYLPLVMR